VYRKIAPGLAFILCLVCLAGAWAQASVDDVIAKLRGVTSGVSVPGWKYVSTDVLGAEKVDFDDSAWQTADPEFDFGAVPVAWMRTTIVIPELIGGVGIAGSKVVFRAGVDDDGECYVNGVLKQKFHWGDCNVVLTENARPGEKLVIAIKGLNGVGSGRLLFARLECASLAELREDASRIAEDLEFAENLANQESDKPRQAVYRAAIEPAVAALDMSALERGDTTTFAKSFPVVRKALAPIGSGLKELTVHLIGHAHIDMNWLWLWPETVDVCKNTFSTMTKLLDEYPTLRFSQSQAATYVAVEEADPQVFARVRERVKSGQWEITGGTWVEGDMNMASGESIVRQILHAKKYFKEKFGVEPVTGWEPDTFGHAWTIPQILAKSGIKYYYFCRCGKNEPVFWWEAPDGSRVLAYNRGMYNGSVGDHVGDAVLDVNKRYGAKDGMIVYGVGDHGGGPTRQDINRAIQLQKREVYPTVKFDTSAGFFETLLAQKKDWPVIRNELNTVFEGCYTSHGDIKKMNRVSENLLPTAEMFSALAEPYGFTYPSRGFEEAWRNTCFNQFHDIFDGTAIHGSYAYSKQLFEKARGVGDAALQGSLKTIVEYVTTSGKGAPVVVFNPLSWKRTDVVRMPVPEALRGKSVVVRDAKGTEQLATVLDGEVIFTAADVPSIGYKVFYLSEHPPFSTGGGLDFIENDFFHVQVDMTTGAVIDIYDKKAGRSILAKGEKGDLLQFLHEDPHSMSAWAIGGITKTESPTLESVQVISQSPVGVLRVKHTFQKSSFTQDITLYPGVPRIDFRMTADWNEVGSGSSGGTMLKVAFPVDVADGEATYEIPFGSIERPAGGHEYPAQKWIDLSNKDYGVSLLNDCKYGHDVNGNVMRLTLLRSPDDPDPKSDVGRHEITYSLYPHQGDWRQADTVRRGYELNNPLIPVVAESHPGRLPRECSFLSVEPSNVIVTALKKAESGDDLILRFYECTGNGGTATLNLGIGAKSLQETDLMERPTGKKIPVSAGRARVPFGKWEIKTLRISDFGLRIAE